MSAKLNNEEFFCSDLPSVPCPEKGTVLVTGATGYIGGRLVPELIARGYSVRAMVRASSPEHRQRWPQAEIVAADALNAHELDQALDGVHTAYYLLHSLLLGPREFEESDIRAAINFRVAAEAQGVHRIIYLGGLGDVRGQLSPHLKSRVQVAHELQAGATATTILRAAIVIGSGSASYEIIKDLVTRLLLIPIPSWGRTLCQPICVRDVIRYLVGVLETPATAGNTYDIGGTDVLTYEAMMRVLADILGRRRVFVRAPISSIGLYAYLANLITSVPGPITFCLMEGLKNEVVCQDHEIQRVIPFRPLTYKEAILDAMSREEQDTIHTRWSDAYPPAHELAIKLNELDEPAAFTCSYALLTNKSAADLFNSVCRIGGREGWFHGNWLWRLRGMLDRILMGVGMSRGRRSASELRTNDVIDFWRVEELVPDRRLLLRAEMKLPGKAWLAFGIEPDAVGNRLRVTAYYDTRSLAGKVYWYICLPFHRFIFDNLIRQIEKRS